MRLLNFSILITEFQHIVADFQQQQNYVLNLDGFYIIDKYEIFFTKKWTRCGHYFAKWLMALGEI